MNAGTRMQTPIPDWYSPYMERMSTGGESMSAKTSEEKKKWLSRLRAGRREISALQRIAAEGKPAAMKRIKEFNAVRQEIQKAIDTLDNADQRAVLRLRYVECMEWHEIAERLHYSDYVYVLHRNALRALNLPDKGRKNSRSYPRQ